MNDNKSLEEITDVARRLVNHAYLKLDTYEIIIKVKKSGAFALVRWNDQEKRIRLTLDKQTLEWHDAQLTGLIAHELSHVALGPKSSEESVDKDVIKRGLGIYLAIERIMSGRHEDHIIVGGKDRYLGYRTIRNCLTTQELEQLEKLLVSLSVYPPFKTITPYYDIAVFAFAEETQIMIGGYRITVNALSHNSNIELNYEGDKIYLVGNENITHINGTINRIHENPQ